MKSDEEPCRKCSGTGEAFGGTCWECKGSGVVSDVRYQTVPFNQSRNPAIVADRNAKPDPFIEPDPLHVAKQLAELKRIVVFEDEPDQRRQEVSMIDCEHTFHAEHYFAAQCTRCRIFKAQYLYSVQTKPEAIWR